MAFSWYCLSKANQLISKSENISRHDKVFKALLFLVSVFNQPAIILRSRFIILTCFIFHVQLDFSEIFQYIRRSKVKAKGKMSLN